MIGVGARVLAFYGALQFNLLGVCWVHRTPLPNAGLHEGAAFPLFVAKHKAAPLLARLQVPNRAGCFARKRKRMGWFGVLIHAYARKHNEDDVTLWPFS